MSKRWQLMMALIALVLMVMVIGQRTQSTSLSANEEQPVNLADADFLPIMLPPESEIFVPVNEVPKTKEPIAYLKEVPDAYKGEMSFFSPINISTEKIDPSIQVYTIISSLKYKGSSGEIFISTGRTALPLTKGIIGEKLTILENEQAVFQSVQNDYNQITWIDRDILISVIGKVSKTELIELAKNISIQ